MEHDPAPILTIALDFARSYTILGDSGRFWEILGDSGRFWEISAIYSPRLPNALDKEPEVFQTETVLRKLESGESLLEAHMTSDRISELVAAGESETLEFKSTTGQRSDAAKSLCAMLNLHGGHVLFGVTPEGAVVGQQVSEDTIEKVSSEIQRIEPRTFPSIERVPVEGGNEVIVVVAPPGPAKPYLYKRVAYRRVGNTTLEMSAEEYNRVLFERMHAERRWENQPTAGWTVDDLDAAEIQKTVREAIRRGRLEDPGTREPAELLRGMKLLKDGVLLRAAAVLFGRTDQIESDMPQCRLRVARFRGVERTAELLDNRQFFGNAFTLLSVAERFLRDTLPIAGRFEPDRFDRIDEPLYPQPATREAIANALCHRDYSIVGGSVAIAVYDDRLEVTSAGALHFGLTPERLFGSHESMPWNPLIARAFYLRGIIEEWGRGIARIVEHSKLAGLATPEIEDAAGCVTVRFRNNRYV
ncbi:MAG: putative DNA binding domain-containing protein, partial [Gemmatimonadota bacterium]|nr:putative DNA binding domain-containing protein [Gemmatimonadota bacterium]